MWVADQSVSRSILTIAIELVISSKDFFGRPLSLLYRVVLCPLMPSMVISEAIMPYNPLSIYPRFLLFTPDGTRILHGSEFGVIRVWDLSLQELIKIQMEWHDLQVGDWVYPTYHPLHQCSHPPSWGHIPQQLPCMCNWGLIPP